MVQFAILTQLKEDLIEKVYLYIPKLITVVLILVIGFFIIKGIKKVVAKFFDKVNFERSVETFIENVIAALLWIVLFIIVLANLGVNVSGLIAGLGIMGFIVGFALKDTLGNLASGVFLLFHRPFKVHDFVEAGGVKGIVLSIGVAATMMRTPDNKKITVPNSAVWGNPIINYTGLGKRRMEIKVGISYSDSMDKAIKIVLDILKKDKRVLKDPKPQVEVTEYGDNSVNLVIRPWVEVKNYWDLYFYLMRTIKKEFDKKGITIPFPQRDVWIKEMKKRS